MTTTPRIPLAVTVVLPNPAAPAGTSNNQNHHQPQGQQQEREEGTRTEAMAIDDNIEQLSDQAKCLLLDGSFSTNQQPNVGDNSAQQNEDKERLSKKYNDKLLQYDRQIEVEPTAADYGQNNEQGDLTVRKQRLPLRRSESLESDGTDDDVLSADAVQDGTASQFWDDSEYGDSLDDDNEEDDKFFENSKPKISFGPEELALSGDLSFQTQESGDGSGPTLLHRNFTTGSIKKTAGSRYGDKLRNSSGGSPMVIGGDSSSIVRANGQSMEEISDCTDLSSYAEDSFRLYAQKKEKNLNHSTDHGTHR